MLNTSLTDDSSSFSARLEVLARTRKFIQRKSKKFSAAGYILALINAVLTGKASFNQLASGLKHSESKTLSKQAFWKRTNHLAVAFMLDALGLALLEQWGKNAPKQPRLKRLFGRVLVEDSTQQKLPKTNHENFPAHGNGVNNTAGVKVDLTVDLIPGHVVASHLHLATEQDREIGKDLVDLVKKRDLVLRDRGYFSLKEFALIEKKKAFWLSRVPSNLIIKLNDGTQLDDHLKACKKNTLDISIQLGDASHTARLVAIRATPAVAEKARRDVRAAAQKSGKAPDKSRLLRCEWHIVVTNVTANMMGADDISELYRCRWIIEIIFRAWKQSANLGKALNRKSSADHFHVLVLASMIYQALSLKAVTFIRTQLKGKKRVSLEKLFDDFAEAFTKFTQLEALWNYQPDHRHVITESRTDRRPLEDTWIKLLS